MIIDKLESIANYKGINKNLDKAIDYIQATDLAGLSAGSHEIDGDNVFAVVLTVKTRPRENGRWESHKTFIEIPIVIAGQELMLGQHTADLGNIQAYDVNQDNISYQDNGKGVIINMSPGVFTIFFPTDAHMPCIMASSPENVKKVIIKVKV